MSDTKREIDGDDDLMKTLRATVGSEAIDVASPGQTMRTRLAATTAHADMATVRAPATTARGQPTVAASGKIPVSPDMATAGRPRSRVVPGTSTLSRFSEYSVRQVVGKGGMGHVYLAGQNALRREVAIKKISPEILTQEGAQETEQAFVSEALVMGYLDHPNIVPVYSLGRDHDGKWFFSMKMVRGNEWRHLLHPDQCKDPETKRKALDASLDIDDPARRIAHLDANLAIFNAVCNAVAFAHSKRIIHRDLKPENVMVGAYGEVLVMDWGLAVDVSESPPPMNSPERRVPTRDECGLGGTPAYMSPEHCEFDANRNYVGTNLNLWTDVFLLGAMLHELLTGRPPFTGDSLRDVYGKVMKCAPPHFPAETPPELAAICIKAMAKNPRDRFPDALHFQNALQGFLKHHQAAKVAAKAERELAGREIPNLARAVVLYDEALELWPENAAFAENTRNLRAELAVKERNVRVTRSAALALAALVFIGMAAGFFWVRDTQIKETALRQEAETQSRLAKDKSAALEITLDRAAKQSKLLSDTLRRQIFQIQDEVKKQPGLQSIKRNLLISAVDGLKKAADMNPNSNEAERDTSIAFYKLGDISLEIGELTSAWGFYQRSLDIALKLAEADKTDDVAQRDLSVSYEKMGDANAKAGDVGKALDFYNKSFAIREKLKTAHPESKEALRDLSKAYNNIGQLHARMADAKGAMDDYQKALAIRKDVAAADASPDSQRDVADSYVKVGLLYTQMGDAVRAMEAFRLSLEIRAKVAEADAGNSEAQRELSVSYIVIGRANVQLGDVSAAVIAYRTSVDILEQQAAKDPLNADVRRFLSFSYINMGDADLQIGDSGAALAAYQKSLKLRELLAAADARNADAQRILAVAQEKMGDAQLLMGDTDGAARMYQTAFEIREELASKDGKNSNSKRDLAMSYEKLGDLQIQLGNVDSALETYAKSVPIREKLADEDKENAEVRRELSVSYKDVGEMKAKLGDTAGAMAELKKSLAIREKAVEKEPKNAPAQRDLAELRIKIGHIHAQEGDDEAAMTAFQDALRIGAALVAEHPRNAAAQRVLSGAQTKIGDAQLRANDAAAALASYQKALEIREKLAEVDAKYAEVQRDMALAHEKIGDAKLKLNDTAASATAYQKALAIRERLAADDPTSAVAQRDLASSLEKIGDVEICTGDIAKAKEAYEKSLAIRQKLATADPKNVAAQVDLGTAFKDLGWAAQNAKEYVPAMAFYEKGLAIFKRLDQAGKLTPLCRELLVATQAKIDECKKMVN